MFRSVYLHQNVTYLPISKSNGYIEKQTKWFFILAELNYFYIFRPCLSFSLYHKLMSVILVASVNKCSEQNLIRTFIYSSFSFNLIFAPTFCFIFETFICLTFYLIHSFSLILFFAWAWEVSPYNKNSNGLSIGCSHRDPSSSFSALSLFYQRYIFIVSLHMP